jgi:hypothetical protein
LAVDPGNPGLDLLEELEGVVKPEALDGMEWKLPHPAAGPAGRKREEPSEERLWMLLLVAVCCLTKSRRWETSCRRAQVCAEGIWTARRKSARSS